MSQLLGTVEGIGSNLASQGQGILDSVFPPERRAAVLDKIKGFVIKNPKLSVQRLDPHPIDWRHG